MAAIIADDGIRLECTQTGDSSGRSVMLLAGFKAPATSWRYQVEPLAQAGCHVLSVNLRGHGSADHPKSGVTMERRGQDVARVLESLDLTDVLLVGGSMGGNTIWSYLSQFGTERTAGIAVVDQTPKMLNTADWPHGYYGYDASNVDTYFAEGIPPTGHGTPVWKRGKRMLRLLKAMRGVDHKLSRGELALLNDHAKADWRPVIEETAVPVLFVAGAESEHWSSTHAAASAGLAPIGSSVVIPNDGHAANIEQPEVFNQILLEFANSL
ncbi:Pimeloyl-ACP methyl ester carboxylesterase [Brevibacterium sandarakinum]|uniref:Pimeloyl-ACP methyl ester carboxylesterase n=1 Tax=Brevibacterium sandarakinum TaxID=629680 RepID=A0A1H1TUA4_BRESA|nr:alpha/beta hydrolase [Brevibacterium sandarakinum]SDS63863.1 Pimeloyl-ACP methyl ester carboxylesterase [Brevibacterium sandarakinum]